MTDDRSPADAKAVTRSTSILADRALELVGNYEVTQKLSPPGGCIPLGRSLTPKSLSQVIGSSTNFINSINPAGSDNIGQMVTGIDEAIRGQGGRRQQVAHHDVVGGRFA